LADAVKTTVDLGTTDAAALKELTLDQPITSKENRVKFAISRSPNSETSPTWEVRLHSLPKKSQNEKSALDAVGTGLDERIGKFSMAKGHLQFMWVASKHTTYADQLRNCVLCIHGNNKQYRLALQSCKQIKPVTIDFDEASQKFELSHVILPPISSLFLEVVALENFNVSEEQQPTDGMVPYNKTVQIKLTNWKSPAEIRVKFGGSRSKPAVIVTANYKLDSRWHAMTIHGVDGALLGLKKTLNRSQGNLSNYQAAARSLPSQISSLRARVNSSGGGIDAARMNSQLLNLSRGLAKAQGGIHRLSRLIPELEAKIPQMERLEELGNRLHKKARIQFRVAVKTENGDFNLLRTSNNPQPSATAEKSQGNPA